MRKKLKDKRKEKQFTQMQMAKNIGISRSAYTNIENGKRTPSLPVALKIKQIINYHNDDLFATE